MNEQIPTSANSEHARDEVQLPEKEELKTENRQSLPVAEKMSIISRKTLSILEWLILVGMTLFWGFFFLLLTVFIFAPGFFKSDFIFEHFAAIVGIPLAAIASFANVIYLERLYGNRYDSTDPSVHFKLFGLEFSGASGPIVMWALSFLSIILAIWLLWKNPGSPAR
jgi:hypothetical protein